jgi:septum formation protein
VELVLASQSPRRSELLRQLGLHFTRLSPQIDEAAFFADKKKPPRATVMQLALAKAGDAANRYAMQNMPTVGSPDDQGEAEQDVAPEALVIAADTIVVLGDEIMQKPESPDHARHMLEKLSGAEHTVLTGICIQRLPQNDSWVHAAKTTVRFRELSGDVIERYVASGSPLDKAGAYGIQDHSPEFPLIQSIDGSYWNVVGLPLDVVVEGLQHFEYEGSQELKVPDTPTLEPRWDT